MKLTVKTLKGGKFPIEVEDSSTVAAVKTTIVRVHMSEEEEADLLWRMLAYYTG